MPDIQDMLNKVTLKCIIQSTHTYIYLWIGLKNMTSTIIAEIAIFTFDMEIYNIMYLYLYLYGYWQKSLRIIIDSVRKQEEID